MQNGSFMVNGLFVAPRDGPLARAVPGLPFSGDTHYLAGEGHPFEVYATAAFLKLV